MTACGWQMRGWDNYQAQKIQGGPTLKTINITNIMREQSFYRQLVTVIKTQGIEQSSQASVHVKLLRETLTRRPLTYSNGSAAAQYELTLTLEFSAQHQQQNTLAAKQ